MNATGDGSAASSHPALGKTELANGLRTNYHDIGQGEPLILLHGSGAGVSGWENWHGVMQELSQRHWVLVPDIVGFGFTERQPDGVYGIKMWVRHLLGFMDALSIPSASFIGNSFGGALALALAIRNRHRVRRMVLMGTPAGEFAQRAASARSWYYQPSVENMAELLKTFPFDPNVVTSDMVRLRHEVTLLPGGMEAYRKLFPEPGPAGEVKAVKGIPEADLKGIDAPILVLHGREDPRVPLECGQRIAAHCPNADLHVFSKCGHWVQVEKRELFLAQSLLFLGA